MSERRSRRNLPDPDLETDPKSKGTQKQESMEETDEPKTSIREVFPSLTSSASTSSGITDNPGSDDSRSSGESNETRKILRSAAKKKQKVRKTQMQTSTEKTLQTKPLTYEEETTSMQHQLEQLQLPKETDRSQSAVDTSNIAAIRPKTLSLLKEKKVEFIKPKTPEDIGGRGKIETPLTQEESSPSISGIQESIEVEDTESQLKSTSEKDPLKKIPEFSKDSKERAEESDAGSEEYSDSSIVGVIGSTRPRRTYSDTKENPSIEAGDIENQLKSTASKNTGRVPKKIRVSSKCFEKLGGTDTGSETPPTEDYSDSSNVARAGSVEELQTSLRPPSTSSVSGLSISMSSDSVFHHDSTVPLEPSICSKDTDFDQSPTAGSLSSVHVNVGDNTKETISVSKEREGHSVLTKTSSGTSKISSEPSKKSSYSSKGSAGTPNESTGQPKGLSMSSGDSVCLQPTGLPPLFGSSSSFLMPSTSQTLSSGESRGGAVAVTVSSEDSTIRGSASSYMRHPPKLPIEPFEEDGFFRTCWSKIVKAKGFFLCMTGLGLVALIAIIVALLYGSDGQPRIQVGSGGGVAPAVAIAPASNINPDTASYAATLVESDRNITRYDDNEDEDMDANNKDGGDEDLGRE